MSDDGWTTVEKKKKPRKPRKTNEEKIALEAQEWTHIEDVPSKIREPRYALQKAYLNTDGNEVSGAASTMCLLGYALYELKGWELREHSTIISATNKEREDANVNRDNSSLVYLKVGSEKLVSESSENARRRRHRTSKCGIHYIVYKRRSQSV